MGGEKLDQSLGAGVAPWPAGAFTPGLLEANEPVREFRRLCRCQLDRFREDGAPLGDSFFPKCGSAGQMRWTNRGMEETLTNPAS